MEFLNIEWENFKAFQGGHRLDFSQYQPGLYFIRGENRSEPELGSNGSSKSTLLDVIHWTLFGVSMRGIRSPQLVPWTAPGRPRASLRLRINKKIITVRRSHRPNTLSIIRKGKETPVTQEQLEDLIGLTPITIQNSILIGQFTQLFFDRKPGEKMAVFAELLDLDYWFQCADNASNTLRILEHDEQKAEIEISNISTLIKEINRSINELRQEKKSDAASTKLHIGVVSKRKRKLNIEKLDIKQQVSDLKKYREAAAKDLIEASILKRQRESEVSDAKVHLSSLTNEEQVKKTLISENKSQLMILLKINGSCTICGQHISASHKQREIAKLTGKRDKLDELVKELETDYSHLVIAVNESEEELKTVQTSITKSIKDRDYYISEIRQLNLKAQNVAQEIDNCNKIMKAVTQRSIDYTTKIKRQKERLEIKKKERMEHRLSLKELRAMMEQARFWIKGFKEIRLYEITEALVSLETEINSYLTDLGMRNWSVSLDVERTTKSGSISKGFQITVDPGDEAEVPARPWEAWSGGEGQRLRLAGTLALANLILRKYDQRSNLQIWDESLLWLSGSGREDMLDLLQEIARREEKTIFIIDQNELSFAFDGVLTIIKDDEGSRFVT